MSLAFVVGSHAGLLTVECPYCGGTHEHPRHSKGSANVVAGCSRGPGQYREYRIPKAGDR